MADTTLPALLGVGDHSSRPAASAVGSGGLYSCTDHGLLYQTDGATWSTWATLGAAASGSITSSGYTQATARMLGRTTASTGAIEEITVGSGLSLSGGSLTATGGSLASAVSIQNTGADYTTTSGTYADIDGTNLSLTMTTGAHRVKVTLCCAIKLNNTSNAGNIDVLVDGTGIGGNGAWQYRPVRASENQHSTFVYVTAALTAASHTIKLQWKVDGNTLTLVRNGFPCTFMIEELGI